MAPTFWKSVQHTAASREATRARIGTRLTFGEDGENCAEKQEPRGEKRVCWGTHAGALFHKNQVKAAGFVAPPLSSSELDWLQLFGEEGGLGR